MAILSISLSADFGSNKLGSSARQRSSTGKKSPQNYFFWQGRDRRKFGMAIGRSLNYNEAWAISAKLNPHAEIMDYSQVLAEKTDTIVQRWIEAVRLDRKIETADALPQSAIENHIPHLLAAMTTVLSQHQNSDIKVIIEASLDHGFAQSGTRLRRSRSSPGIPLIASSNILPIRSRIASRNHRRRIQSFSADRCRNRRSDCPVF
jgi:hypothetical protein